MYSSQTFLRVAFQAVAQRRLYPGKGKDVYKRQGKGGDIFTLAGEFIGSNDFMEQVKFIAETANMPMPDVYKRQPIR